MKHACLFLAAFLLCACTRYERTAVTLPDGFVVRARVADTPQKTEKGLMFVKRLAPDEGMLFVFDKEDDHMFWMKNTLVDLDIIFIAPDKTVTRVYEQVPRSYTYTPDTDVAYAPGRGQYVLETPAKTAARHGVTAGAKLSFDGLNGL